MNNTLRINSKLLLLLLTIAVLALPHHTWAHVVKQSNSGLCHPPESAFYERTQKFTAFKSVSACLKSGGELPKSLQDQTGTQPKTENTGYARERFGHGWADTDGDCQNARMEALISLSTNKVRFASDKECRVVAGRWISPFTGDVIHDASTLDVDHVVPLKWAWEHGADSWSQEKRETFANDLRNLWPVEASLNRSKGARGPDDWLPPSGQCQYVLRFIQNVKRYNLDQERMLRSVYDSVCD